MPVVHVTVWAGITKDHKKKLVKGITKACEEIGIPRVRHRHRLRSPEDQLGKWWKVAFGKVCQALG